MQRVTSAGKHVTHGELITITGIYVIYQTGETVFHVDIQTPRTELKIPRVAEYF